MKKFIVFMESWDSGNQILKKIVAESETSALMKVYEELEKDSLNRYKDTVGKDSEEWNEFLQFVEQIANSGNMSQAVSFLEDYSFGVIEDY